MLFEIGQYRLDIDVPKTRQFYETADVVSKSCSCDGCLNFERAVSKLPPVIISFFTNLGVDMRKIYKYCFAVNVKCAYSKVIEIELKI